MTQNETTVTIAWRRDGKVAIRAERHCPPLAELLKHALPSRKRRWSPAEGAWLVAADYADRAIELCRWFFRNVDVTREEAK